MLLFSNALINVEICQLPRKIPPHLWQKNRETPQMNYVFMDHLSQQKVVFFLIQRSFKYLLIEKVKNCLLNKNVKPSSLQKKGKAISKIIHGFPGEALKKSFLKLWGKKRKKTCSSGNKIFLKIFYGNPRSTCSAKTF